MDAAVEQGLREVDVERRVEVVPGTELMEDFGGMHFIHAHNSPKATVLIPQPSASPHDPLVRTTMHKHLNELIGQQNWSKKWKNIVMANQVAFVTLSILPALSISPMSTVYMAEWNKTLQQVALLTGVLVIVLGYFNFVIIPCANLFGRRPVQVVCAIITLACDIWQATAKSYDSFLVARLVSGIGAAANETVMPIVVTDIFFLHERGFHIGIYFWCYFVGVMIGPIIAGNIADTIGWRWFFWLCTILQALNVVSLVFLFPETQRIRDTQTLDTVITESYKNEEAVDQVETPSEDGKQTAIVEATTAHPTHSDSEKQTTTGTVVDECLGRGKPNRAQFNLVQPINRQAKDMILHHILTPIRIIFLPIVLWAALCMCFAAITLFLVNITQDQALSVPPYNFSPATIGFANFALAVGGMIGLGAAGPLSDWVAMRATKRNGGIREPEMRLPAIIPFIVTAVIGLVVVGVGFQKGWPWEAVIIVGFTCCGFVTVGMPTVAVTYAIDCYKPISSYILVTATVFKNTFAFGMTYYVNDWAARSGFIAPYMMVLGFTVGFSLLGLVVFMRWGKTFRTWTKDSSVHKLWK